MANKIKVFTRKDLYEESKKYIPIEYHPAREYVDSYYTYINDEGREVKWEGEVLTDTEGEYFEEGSFYGVIDYTDSFELTYHPEVEEVIEKWIAHNPQTGEDKEVYPSEININNKGIYEYEYETERVYEVEHILPAPEIPERFTYRDEDNILHELTKEECIYDEENDKYTYVTNDDSYYEVTTEDIITIPVIVNNDDSTEYSNENSNEGSNEGSSDSVITYKFRDKQGKLHTDINPENIEFKYKTSEVEKIEVTLNPGTNDVSNDDIINDLSRYLSALYENGIEEITYNNKLYTWNSESQKPASKFENNGKTLISDLIAVIIPNIKMRGSYQFTLGVGNELINFDLSKDEYVNNLVDDDDILVDEMPLETTTITWEWDENDAKYKFYATSEHGIKVEIIVSNWDNYDQYIAYWGENFADHQPTLVEFLNTKFFTGYGVPENSDLISKTEKKAPIYNEPRFCIEDDKKIDIIIPEDVDVDYMIIHASGHNGAYTELDYVQGYEDKVFIPETVIVPGNVGTTDLKVFFREKAEKYQIHNGTSENCKKFWGSFKFYKYPEGKQKPILPKPIYSSVQVSDEYYTTFEQDGEKISTGINALSGICLAEDKSCLYGASDTYGLYKINFDGTTELLWDSQDSLDMEGITIDENGDLYVCVENEQKVVKFSKADGYHTPEVVSEVDAEALVDIMKEFNNGFEGIAYKGNGTFLIGNQFKPISVTEYNLTTGINEANSFVLKQHNVIGGTSEVGDLQYDPSTNTIWVIDSRSSNIYNYDLQGNNIASYKTNLGSAPNTESFVIDFENNILYVGCDNATGDLYKFTFTKSIIPTPEEVEVEKVIDIYGSMKKAAKAEFENYEYKGIINVDYTQTYHYQITDLVEDEYYYMDGNEKIEVNKEDVLVENENEIIKYYFNKEIVTLYDLEKEGNDYFYMKDGSPVYVSIEDIIPLYHYTGELVYNVTYIPKVDEVYESFYVTHNGTREAVFITDRALQAIGNDNYIYVTSKWGSVLCEVTHIPGVEHVDAYYTYHNPFNDKDIVYNGDETEVANITISKPYKLTYKAEVPSYEPYWTYTQIRYLFKYEGIADTIVVIYEDNDNKARNLYYEILKETHSPAEANLISKNATLSKVYKEILYKGTHDMNNNDEIEPDESKENTDKTKGDEGFIDIIYNGDGTYSGINPNA